MKIKRKLSYWGGSLRRLPWDQDVNASLTEKLISVTISEWYKEKHRTLSIDEVQLINSIQTTFCRRCNSLQISKNGFYKNGIQRYHCKQCNSNFSPLTNTIFESRKIPISEWIEYLIHLLEFHSIKTSARDNRNAESTGKYWLYKVFSILKNIQDNVILKGKIYLDEMYFPVIKRSTFIRNGKQLRGISKNKIGVAVAFDNNGNYLFIVEYTSKPSDRSTWEALGNHIKPGSHLIHDGERSHGVLIRNLNLTEEYYKTDYTKRLSDEANPLHPINHLHALAKRFMREHGGYNRQNLQDWMNIIWFIFSPPNNRYEKIVKFINLALVSPKKVKFRDTMGRKH